jgi:hypothetical protein
MRSMTILRSSGSWQPLWQGSWLRVFGLGGLWLAVAAVGHAATLPNPRLAGHWQLDVAASESFDARLQEYVAEVEKSQRHHGHQHHDIALTKAEAAADVPDDLPPEPTETQRTRLAESLRPPDTLAIELQADTVSLSGDDLPPSSITLDEKIIRVDASGSAVISASASGAGLTLSYRYLNRSRRTQQYAVGSQGDTLQVTLVWQSPGNGKFTVKSLYRRRGP